MPRGKPRRAAKNVSALIVELASAEQGPAPPLSPALTDHPCQSLINPLLANDYQYTEPLTPESGILNPLAWNQGLDLLPDSNIKVEEGETQLLQYGLPDHPQPSFVEIYPEIVDAESTMSLSIAGNTDLAASENLKRIPLTCHICPQKPNFSDLSHLLTHLSSKSHLANTFKAKCLAKTVPARQSDLDDYEAWYAEHDIQTHVDKRMAAKEKKQAIKAESTPIPSFANLPIPPANVNTEGSAGTDATNSAGGQQPSRRGRISGLSIPLPNDDSSCMSLLDSSYSKADTSYASTEATQFSRISDDATINSTDSQSKLKGVVWPGMDFFDSATPDQRRRRNQKKNASVLQNMILHSQGIAQNEYVWDHEFADIQRVRNVYDDPSDIESRESPAKPRRQLRKNTSPTTRRPRATAGKSGRRGKRDAADMERSSPASKPAGKAKAPRRGKKQKTQDDQHDSAIKEEESVLPFESSPLNMMNSREGQTSQGSIRQALQTLSSNVPLMSPTPMAKHHHSTSFTYKHEAETNPFDFAQEPHFDLSNLYTAPMMQTAEQALNPLCMQGTDNTPYFYQQLSSLESSNPFASFQSMNEMDYTLETVEPFIPEGDHDRHDYDI